MGFDGGWQCALWLPPREDQCCFWHLRLQYRTALHLAQHWLTLSLPVTPQSRLPQLRAPSAAAFFPLPIDIILLVREKGGDTPLPGKGR